MEAYHVLLGHVTMDNDGKFIAVEDVGVSWGPSDGATKLRTLGVTQVHRLYDSGRDKTRAVYDTEKVFSYIGRGIRFLSREKVYGCQIKTYIFYPVVLAFYENDDHRLQLSAFSARCLTSRLAIFFAIRKFEKGTAAFLVRAASEKKEGVMEEKAEKKAERALKKKEAKERREQARLEKEAREINEAAEK